MPIIGLCRAHLRSVCTAMIVFTKSQIVPRFKQNFHKTDLSGGSRIFRADDFGNPTKTEGVWAYGRILCICELVRGHN